MRIAFLGKGGSGKTTISSLAARLSPAIFEETYVIDSDINMHMKGALGLDRTHINPFPPLFQAYEAQIRQTHPGVSQLKSLPRTLPVWSDNELVELSFMKQPFAAFDQQHKTMVFELGGYSEKNMGWSCHHSSLGKLQLVLGHTKDTDSQVVIADLTAGADVFGVGMLGLFDMVFVVVEPTLKSTDIFNQLKELAAVDGLQLVPIANKIIDDSDVRFIEQRIGVLPAYTISLSNFVRRLERGEAVTNDDIEAENRQMIQALLADVQSYERDTKAMYRLMVKSHERAADNWPKDKYGAVDLRTLVNPAYSGV